MNDASYSKQLINLKRWIAEHRSEEECIHFYAQSLLDAAEDSNKIECLAKQVLPPEWVDGDSYYVPDQVDIVERLVEEIRRLRQS